MRIPSAAKYLASALLCLLGCMHALTANDAPHSTSAVEMPQFTAAPTSQHQSIAEIKNVGGVPTLVVDGSPYGPMTYTRCAGTLPQIGEIADHRFQIYFEMVGSIGWPGKQGDVFKRLDKQIASFLHEVPNAKLILRLYVCNPPHFARDYPQEVLRFDDGSTQHFQTWYAMTDRPLEERGYPSFASNVWRKATAQSLAEYVTHVRQSAYASHIIGYFVCGGGTEEWYYWGDYDHKYAVDFSQPMLRAFRDFLRHKYHGDVQQLREAWLDPTVNFDTALPPDAKMRFKATGSFWDPAVRCRMRDYYEVHSRVMEESVLIFAHAVKQACNRQQLVGMFHGYLQNHWLLEGGQATLLDALNSPDIDFWAAPPQYDRRGQGDHGCFRFPIASMKLHNKLWVSEADHRTPFSEVSASNPSFYGRPPTLDETLAVMKREFAHEICEGGNGWWFQMGKQWYHHPPILSLFEQMETIGQAAVGLPRKTETDIATVIDLKSLLQGPPFTVSAPLIDAFKVQETCRIGSPVDHYELQDILAPNVKHYKMYLMLNCFSLTDAERRLIDERLRRDGAVLVWMVAPGVFNPDRKPEQNVDYCRQLLGFSLQTTVDKPRSLNMLLTDAGANYFTGFDRTRRFGSFERPKWEIDKKSGKLVQRTPGENRLQQRFFADEKADVLARFVDGGQPAIAMRQSSKSVDIWIGSVMAPADLLRTIARRAGCHLYCDGDEIIYANESFLAIHTAKSGTRHFKLRRPCDVIEVFSGDVLAHNATEFTDAIDAYRTRLYYIGPEARWQAERRRADEKLQQFEIELKRLRAEHR